MFRQILGIVLALFMILGLIRSFVLYCPPNCAANITYLNSSLSVCVVANMS